MITKNSVVKIENLVLNHESRPVKSNPGIIWKITTGQGDDYAAICLLGYYYFSKYYKRIAINLSKQQALDAGPKALQQIDLTGNLARDSNVNTTIIFFIEEVKKPFS